MARPGPIVIKTACLALVVVQSFYIGYGLYQFIDLHTATDETSMAGKDVLQPLMLIVVVLSSGLLLTTLAVIRHRERKHAWVGLILLIALTVSPVALMLLC